MFWLKILCWQLIFFTTCWISLTNLLSSTGKIPDNLIFKAKVKNNVNSTHSSGLSSWDIWVNGASGPTIFSSKLVFSTHMTPAGSSSSSDSSLLEPLDSLRFFFAFFFLDFFDLLRSTMISYWNYPAQSYYFSHWMVAFTFCFSFSFSSFSLFLLKNKHTVGQLMGD